jgi:crotonobetainyl-CoA:carnitine CoA-transferase CaiB-like acyl-CoA transferase
MQQALSDITMLDLTWYIAGPYCSKLFADYGADVIKVEKPGEGDPARRMKPFVGDEPHPEKSGLFLHLNTNKRGITLNLRSDAGKKIFKDLVKKADIIIENFSPGVMSRLGLDYEALEQINPRLVMTSISNFGQTGPYRDYKGSDLVFQGWGGPMYSYGLPDRAPLKKGGTVGLYQAGALAAVATMFAFYAARYQGIGQQVDISIFESQAGSIDRRRAQCLGYQYNEEITPRNDMRQMMRYPHGIYPCADGYFDIAGGFQVWPRIARMIGRPDMADDPLLTSVRSMVDPAAREKVMPIWLPWCMEHTKKEVIEAGQRERNMCGPINTMEEVFNDPHWKERKFWVEVEHPVAGRLVYPGAPGQGSETKWEIRRPAPLLGQHNKEVYGALGCSKKYLSALSKQGVI